MESINKKVKNVNEDDDILDVIIENEDEIIANSMYEKGISKGIKKGMNEGKLKQKKEIAERMLKKNISLDDIVEITGLSKDEIEKL